MMNRLEWRRAVRQSRLPGSVRVTLLTHADLGWARFHDDRANVHAFSRERLAKATGRDERTIQRHLRLAEDVGWLKRHAGGYHGKQVQFHYTIPAAPEPCSDCSRRETESSPEGRQNPALKGDRIPVETETSLAPFPRPKLSPLISTANATGLTAKRSAADPPDPQDNPSALQASFSQPLAAASPATKLSSATNSGPNATTVGVTECRCGGQLVGVMQRSSGLCGPCLLKAQAV
jgi:hypothetical protein